MNVIDSIKDDNDLFSRSVQLMNICTKSTLTSNIEPNNSFLKHVKTSTGNNKRIVFSALRALEKAGKLEDRLLLDLQESNYTQRNFKISRYPFLITKSQFEKSFEPKERKRYYAPELFLYKGVNYMVCSQWIPERIKLLNNWIKTIL